MSAAEDLTQQELQWIRALLTEWGIWHNMTHNLPASARLRTGGNDLLHTSESQELTHMAVMHLKARAPKHYSLIKWLYDPVDGRTLSQKEIFEDEAKRQWLGFKSKGELSKSRAWAEMKVASFRQGMSVAKDTG